MRKKNFFAFLAAAALCASAAAGAVTEFGNISVDVPEGWTTQPLDSGVQIVSRAHGAVVSVFASEGDAEGVDSKTYAEIFSANLQGTVPADAGNGRWCFTTRAAGGQLSRMLAWAKAGTGYGVVAIGSAPELSGLLASLVIGGERPDPEKSFAKLDGHFGHFYAEVPAGWTVEDGEQGSVMFMSPGNTAIAAVETLEGDESETPEAFAELLAQHYGENGNKVEAPVKTARGYCKIPFVNPSGVAGYVLAGLEGGGRLTVMVIGEHGDLAALLRSFKAGYGRDMLAAMLEEAAR